MDVTIKKISRLQIDEILNLIGTFNQYQKVIYCLLCFVIFRGVFPVLGIILIGRDPGHVCNATFHDDNLTTTTTPDQETDPQCYMHGIRDNKNVTVPCPGPWNYNKSFTSIVTEWDLVCDRTYLVDLSSTVYMIGSAFGCLFLMPLGDKFGRRPVLFVCLVIITILNIALAFSNFIWLFISLRFFIGALNMAISLITYCMISELLPSTHRTLPVIGASLFWSFGIMILALAGYLIKDWKILQIVISLPNLIVILLWWFLPESVTWLFLKENYKETIKIIKSAAKWNKKPLPSDLFYESLCSDPAEALGQKAADSHSPKEDSKAFVATDLAKHHPMHDSTTLLPTETNKGSLLEVERERSHLSTANGVSDVSNGETFQVNNCLANCETSSNDDEIPLSTDVAVSIRSLFATPRMLTYTLITYYLLMVVSLSYFGILLNTPALPGNIYMNLVFTSAVEIAANVVVMCVVGRMGRRKPICCLLMISGISNLLALEVFYPGIKSRYILMLVWTMIGRFGITGSYNMLYLLLAEIFPTTVRNQAMGSASLFENLGSILAPIVILLAKNDVMVPLIIFGVLTLIGALLVLVLPETHLKPLPSSVKQVESW